MLEVVTVDDAQYPPELALRPDGQPTRVVRRYDLDQWREQDPDTIARAARCVNESSVLAIGTATAPPSARLEPLLDALTVTLAGPDADAADPRIVTMDDIAAGVETINRAARACPQTCVATGRLLRQTPQLSVGSGLAAEAAVYSMLLGGNEFATWLSRRTAAPASPEPYRPLLRLARDGDALSIVLDHPERRNAFSFAMREELLAALEFAELDETLGKIELSGSGSVFCSGGDLAEFGTATDPVAAYLVRLDRAPWQRIDRMRDRITVRVHGAAIGAGLEMAAFAGRVVATPDTFFLLPEIAMGLVPGAGGTVSIPRRIGRWRTAWMALSGQRVDAETALKWGLIDVLAP